MSEPEYEMHKSTPLRFGSLAVQAPLVLPGQRIGIMGGSFNPPHEAHRIIAQVALKRLGLDKLWWMVTPGNPLKHNGNLAPLEERMALARIVARDGRIIVTGLEKDLPSPFTAGTLAHLKLRHPGVGFVWIMGADCLASFHRWQHWRDIFASMPVAVVDRPGWRFKALSSPAGRSYERWRLPEQEARTLIRQPLPAWTVLTGPLLDISSTQIREEAASRAANTHVN